MSIATAILAAVFASTELQLFMLCVVLLQVHAHEHLVAPNTEHLFPDQFWEGIHFVTNALDNVKVWLSIIQCMFDITMQPKLQCFCYVSVQHAIMGSMCVH
jgi:hypothetical protein